MSIYISDVTFFQVDMAIFLGLIWLQRLVCRLHYVKPNVVMQHEIEMCLCFSKTKHWEGLMRIMSDSKKTKLKEVVTLTPAL